MLTPDSRTWLDDFLAEAAFRSPGRKGDAPLVSLAVPDELSFAVLIGGIDEGDAIERGRRAAAAKSDEERRAILLADVGGTGAVIRGTPRNNMNADRRNRWTVTGKDSRREHAYYLIRPGHPPGWFPEVLARRKAWNFDAWANRPDQPPSAG